MKFYIVQCPRLWKYARPLKFVTWTDREPISDGTNWILHGPRNLAHVITKHNPWYAYYKAAKDFKLVQIDEEEVSSIINEVHKCVSKNIQARKDFESTKKLN